MKTESIAYEVSQMSQEEKDRALVELVRHNTELSLTIQREVGKVRMTMNLLVGLAELADKGENVYEELLTYINQYRLNHQSRLP